MPLQNANILQVLPALHNGGVERGTLEISKAIVEAGGHAFVTSNGGRLVDPLEKTGAIHLDLPLHLKSPLSLYKNYKQLLILCQRHDIRLIHARSRAPAWPAYYVAKALKIPFITTYHGIYSANNSLKRYYNSIMTRGEPIIAVSNFVKDYVLMQHPKVDADSITVIPRGVDLELFNRAQVSKKRVERIKQDWGISGSNQPILLIPGRLSRWKGQKLTIEALATLKDLNWQAVFVGGGSDHFKAELTKLARQHDIQRQITWAGTTGDMPAAYCAADVVLCPSTRPEAFGRTVIEAQAMHVPVVAINHGGAAETIADTVTGWHVQPGSKDELIKGLSDKIEMVLDMDITAKQQVTAQAAKNVAEHYTTWNMTQQTLGVYESYL